jgi:hypothetical protein
LPVQFEKESGHVQRLSLTAASATNILYSVRSIPRAFQTLYQKGNPINVRKHFFLWKFWGHRGSRLLLGFKKK